MRGGGGSWGGERFLPPNRGTARATPSQGRVARISSAPGHIGASSPSGNARGACLGCHTEALSFATEMYDDTFFVNRLCELASREQNRNFLFHLKNTGGQKKKKKVKKFLFCSRGVMTKSERKYSSELPRTRSVQNQSRSDWK